MEGKYQMEVTYERGGIRAVLLPDHHVSWLSFAVEQGLQWFIGKGIWKMTVERRRLPDGRIELLMESDGVEPKALSFSGAALIKHIAQEGFIPASLDQPYQIVDEGTVVASEGLDQEMTLSFLAYGFSDMIAAFFLGGVECARYQISADRAQLWVDIGMSREQLAAFISTDRDYGPETTLHSLPWRK